MTDKDGTVFHFIVEGNLISDVTKIPPEVNIHTHAHTHIYIYACILCVSIDFIRLIQLSTDLTQHKFVFRNCMLYPVGMT